MYMFEWFRRNKTEQNNNDSEEVEVEETDSVGNVRSKRTMTLRKAKAGGFSYTQKEKTVQAPEAPSESSSWWNRKGKTPVENFTLEEETRSPEEIRREGERVAGVVADTTLSEVASREDVPVGAKLEMSGSEVKQELEGEIKKQKFFGRKSVDALTGFAFGAFTAKTMIGWGAKTAIKRGFDFVVPGTGALAGAVAAGSYEFILATRDERKRVRAEREELHGEVGAERLKEIIAEVRNNSEAEYTSPYTTEIYERYQKSKVNKKKIAKAVVRGALVGGIGGFAGGYLAEKFLGGVAYAAESFAGDVAKAGAKETAKSFAYDHTEAGTKKLVSVFESKVVSVPGASVGEQEMNGSVWNTVKEYLKSHGIEKPSNNLVNEATRIITAENSVEITSDAAPAMGSVKDIAMNQGFKLGGFEKLNELITDAGGEVVEQAREVTIGAPIELPKAGYFPKAFMSEVSTISVKTLRTAGAIVLVLGTSAAAIAAARKFKRREKGSTDEIPVVPEKRKRETIKITPAYSRRKQREGSLREKDTIADEQIAIQTGIEDEEERKARQDIREAKEYDNQQDLNDVEAFLVEAERAIDAGDIDLAEDCFGKATRVLGDLDNEHLTALMLLQQDNLKPRLKEVGERVVALKEEAGSSVESELKDYMDIYGYTLLQIEDLLDEGRFEQAKADLDAMKARLHDEETFEDVYNNESHTAVSKRISAIERRLGIEIKPGPEQEQESQQDAMEMRTRSHIEDGNNFVTAVEEKDFDAAEEWYEKFISKDKNSFDSGSPEVRAIEKEAEAAAVEIVKYAIESLSDDLKAADRALEAGDYNAAAQSIEKVGFILGKKSRLSEKLHGPAFSAVKTRLAHIVDAYNAGVGLVDRFDKSPAIEVYGNLGSLRVAVKNKDIPAVMKFASAVEEHRELLEKNEFKELGSRVRTLLVEHAREGIDEAEGLRFQGDIEGAEKKIKQAEQALRHVVFEGVKNTEQIALLVSLERAKSDIVRSVEASKLEAPADLEQGVFNDGMERLKTAMKGKVYSDAIEIADAMIRLSSSQPSIKTTPEQEDLISRTQDYLIQNAAVHLEQAEEDIQAGKEGALDAINLVKSDLDHVIFKGVKNAEQVALLAKAVRLEKVIEKQKADQEVIDTIPEQASNEEETKSLTASEEISSSEGKEAESAPEKQEAASDVSTEVRAKFADLDGYLKRIEQGGERVHLAERSFLTKLDGIKSYASLKGKDFAVYNVLRRGVVQRLVNAYRGEFAEKVWEKLAPGAEFNFEIQTKTLQEKTTSKKERESAGTSSKKRTPRKKSFRKNPEPQVEPSVEPERTQEPEQAPEEEVQKGEDVPVQPTEEAPAVSEMEAPAASASETKDEIPEETLQDILARVQESGGVTKKQFTELNGLFAQYENTGDEHALEGAEELLRKAGKGFATEMLHAAIKKRLPKKNSKRKKGK